MINLLDNLSDSGWPDQIKSMTNQTEQTTALEQSDQAQFSRANKFLQSLELPQLKKRYNKYEKMNQTCRGGHKKLYFFKMMAVIQEIMRRGLEVEKVLK